MAPLLAGAGKLRSPNRSGDTPVADSEPKPNSTTLQSVRIRFADKPGNSNGSGAFLSPVCAEGAAKLRVLRETSACGCRFAATGLRKAPLLSRTPLLSRNRRCAFQKAHNKRPLLPKTTIGTMTAIGGRSAAAPCALSLMAKTDHSTLGGVYKHPQTSLPKDGEPPVSVPTSFPKDGEPPVNTPTSLPKDGEPPVNAPTTFPKDGEPLVNTPTSLPKDGEPLVNLPTSFPDDGEPRRDIQLPNNKQNKP